MQLVVNCSWGSLHYRDYRLVSGTVNPFDDMECNFGVSAARVDEYDPYP